LMPWPVPLIHACTGSASKQGGVDDHGLAFTSVSTLAVGRITRNVLAGFSFKGMPNSYAVNL
jgi:hypothetical protein